METLHSIKNRRENAIPGPHAWTDGGELVSKADPIDLPDGDRVIFVHKFGCVGIAGGDQKFYGSAWQDVGVLMDALRLACDRIADSDQTYAECTDAESWAERFIEQAQIPSGK